MIFHENCLPADDSHEISCLISYFWKSSKIKNCRLLQIIGGALWVKYQPKKVIFHITAWYMNKESSALVRPIYHSAIQGTLWLTCIIYIRTYLSLHCLEIHNLECSKIWLVFFFLFFIYYCGYQCFENSSDSPDQTASELIRLLLMDLSALGLHCWSSHLLQGN